MTSIDTLVMDSLTNSKTRQTLKPKSTSVAFIETLALGENEMKHNNIEDLSEEEIQEAIDYVLKTSIYSGSSRNLMVQAISDTVHGKMSLTQAAAKFGIPFSTIHPYIKKLRTKLHLRDPALEAKK